MDKLHCTAEIILKGRVRGVCLAFDYVPAAKRAEKLFLDIFREDAQELHGMGDGAYWFEELKEPFMDLDSYEYLPEIVNRRALALCFAAELVRTGSYPFKKRKRKRKRK